MFGVERQKKKEGRRQGMNENPESWMAELSKGIYLSFNLALDIVSFRP